MPPSQFGDEPVAKYAATLLVGVLFLAVPPQIIYALRRPSWRGDGPVDPTPAAPDADTHDGTAQVP